MAAASSTIKYEVNHSFFGRFIDVFFSLFFSPLGLFLYPLLVSLGVASGYEYGTMGIIGGIVSGFCVLPLCMATARRKYQHSQAYTGVTYVPLKKYHTIFSELIEFQFDFAQGKIFESYVSSRGKKNTYKKHTINKANFFFLPFGLIVYTKYFGDNWHIPYPKDKHVKQELIASLKRHRSTQND